MYDYEIPNHDHDFFGHFPDEISSMLDTYIRDRVLQDSRYLFTRREGRKQFTYCTHCKTEHESKGLRHGKSWQCPNCKSLVWVKASGRGRQYLIDEAYLLWYEKSKVDQNSLIARGFFIQRDYSGDYHKTETLIKPIAFYLFEWGKGGRMMSRPAEVYYRPWDKWQERKKIHSEATQSMSNKPCYHNVQNIKMAVKDTPFEYCCWEHYEYYDFVTVFDLAARYGCIEFLTKFGFGSVVEAKLEGRQTYASVNWRGKNAEKVMKLPLHEIKKLKKEKWIDPRTLRMYQLSRLDGTNLSLKDSRTVSDLLDSHDQEILRKLPYANASVIKKYLLKQIRRDDNNYRRGYDVLTAWRDYLEECRELGIDINQERYLFPNDLHSAHQTTMKKVKIKADKALNERIKKRLKSLEPFTFENDQFFIRPAYSSIELFEEGKALSHCVGIYTKRYAEGECDLFVVRKRIEPDKPFYTVEVKKRKITQAYGFKNCLPTEEVKAFLDTFTTEKLTKKRRKVAV